MVQVVPLPLAHAREHQVREPSIKLRGGVVGLGKQALEDHIPGLLDSDAAELVATCVACDKTDETKRWEAALQAEYKRFPALRDELERAARAR